MASEPKRRHSKARKRVRRAAINLAVNLVACKNCGKLTVPHTVCKECGFYGGKAVAKEKVQVTKA
ncbi:50S ribosomal protein L32 [Candidatus Daviesbacteria bacterium RIFCSPHIGHO2_01_FULL_40_11]|uniref:Large ribosomal subunit protein bL32 n=1 Tax=Candidatus Daviesbacteria bacterium RIFCSPHIGHO2_01_FULL_40_11 TaxID=1797762 RepID=A0A1F5JLR6_9BACT|nr:MAG: 50S ribosomal protein L32 [Candidatus Daviesbacteria bacterium RIFCSPHIGHO2_01_FULL_40_11]OGE62563.1 MAG: 50S ribosomal protein L32 [Candidatus Daviesbacteria bacterium RIFCSPLOWO2_01_FULL_40_27]